MRRTAAFAALCLAVFFSAAAAQSIHPDRGRDLVEIPVFRGMQAYMLEKRFDAWIFTGQGEFDLAAREMLGLSGSTRHRWFIVLPGMSTVKRPCVVYHPDDEKVFSGIKMFPLPYRSRTELEQHFTSYFYRFVRKAALNYSADYNVPDMDQAGAGVVEWLRKMNIEVISAGSMLSFFNTRWMLGQVDSHRAAAAGLDSVLGRSVLWLGARLAAGKKTTDWDMASQVERELKKAGLASVAPVSVRLDSLTRLTDPALPDRKHPLTISRGSLIYLEAAARQRKAELPMFARLGWTLLADTTVNAPLDAQWKMITAAADAAVDYLGLQMGSGKEVLGYQVDDTARAQFDSPDMLPRPLGFNLNPWNHSYGVQFDNWLSHDDREVMPGMGFTLEPGIWSNNALRMCANLIISSGPDGKPAVELSAPLQRRIIPLLAGENGLKEAFAMPEK